MKRKRRQRSEAAKQQARERFERHFGVLDLGYATGADNEQIDADLAQAYLATQGAVQSFAAHQLSNPGLGQYHSAGLRFCGLIPDC